MVFNSHFHVDIPDRKITNVARLWFQHSKYRYSFHIGEQGRVKGCSLQIKSAQSCLSDWQEAVTKKNKTKTSKLVEGQGREKRVHFPYSTQLGSYSFSPIFRGGIKMVGAPSFKKKQSITCIGLERSKYVTTAWSQGQAGQSDSVACKVTVKKLVTVK